MWILFLGCIISKNCASIYSFFFLNNPKMDAQLFCASILGCTIYMYFGYIYFGMHNSYFGMHNYIFWDAQFHIYFGMHKYIFWDAQFSRMHVNEDP